MTLHSTPLMYACGGTITVVRCHVQVAAINTAMGSLVKTCTTFPAERTIVTRERSKKGYEVGPYFVAKLLAELPVGALFPAAFGLLVYPTTGLHHKWSRYRSFSSHALCKVHSFIVGC